MFVFTYYHKEIMNKIARYAQIPIETLGLNITILLPQLKIYMEYKL